MNLTSDYQNRIGKFTVSASILQSAPDDEINSLFDGMRIVRAEMMFRCHEIDYIAIHRDFDEIERGELIPEYAIQFVFDGGVVRRSGFIRK